MQNYNLKSVKSGNTYKGARITLPVDPIYSLIGATIIIQVRKEIGSRIFATMSTEAGNSKIIVVSEYVCEIVPHVVNLKGDSYVFDAKFIFSDGREKTLFGGMWEIEDVVTVTTQAI